MKNSIKKALTFMLAILFALSFVGCSKNSDNSNNNDLQQEENYSQTELDKPKEEKIVGIWKGTNSDINDIMQMNCKITFKNNGEYTIVFDEDSVRELIVEMLMAVVDNAVNQVNVDEKAIYDQAEKVLKEDEYYQRLINGYSATYSFDGEVLKMQETRTGGEGIIEYQVEFSDDQLKLESIEADMKYILKRE